MRNQYVDKFGELLMASVRDEIRESLEMIADGRMKGRDPVELRMLLSQHKQCDPVLRIMLPYVIDSTIHAMLDLFEQNPEVLRLMANGPDGTLIDLHEASDGLAGELYSDKGWIAKYSRYPQSLLGT